MSTTDTDSDRLAKIRKHCRDRISSLDSTRDALDRDGGYNPVIGELRAALNKILDMTYGLIVVALIAFAGCALDADPTSPDAGLPTCESLGAAPNMNLLCNVRGYCVYDGQQCERGSGDGSGSGSGSGDTAGSAASGGTP